MTKGPRRCTKSRSVRLALLALGSFITAGSTARATVPVNPLPTPLFSYDSMSIQVTGPPNFKPADVLEEGPLVGPALVIVPAAGLGLNANGDALNGLSFANNSWDPTAPFTMLFSLDRTSEGLAPPDPQLFGNCLPFNAKDQCDRGTQAGDMYMSTGGFVLNGAFRRPQNSVALSMNSILVVNNYDEGGTDHKANPPGPASTTATANRDASQGIIDDEVSSSAYQNGPMPPSMPVTRVYYTAIAGLGSPSLNMLSFPQPASKANIFYRQNPGAGTTSVFVSALDLGLVLTDEIDAIQVFDFNNNGVFDGADQVLFSLARESTSISPPTPTIVGTPADIFRKRAGVAGIEVFASAADFGLNPATDNIDSLEILPCPDPLTCALDHGILGDSVVGGCPTVSTWGLITFTLLLAAAGTLVIRRRQTLRQLTD